MDFRKVFHTAVYWIFLLFLLILIFELIRKLFGGSWGFEELVIGLLCANLGYSFYLNSKLSEHIGLHKGKNN